MVYICCGAPNFCVISCFPKYWYDFIYEWTKRYIKLLFILGRYEPKLNSSEKFLSRPQYQICSKSVMEINMQMDKLTRTTSTLRAHFTHFVQTTHSKSVWNFDVCLAAEALGPDTEVWSGSFNTVTTKYISGIESVWKMLFGGLIHVLANSKCRTW